MESKKIKNYISNSNIPKSICIYLNQLVDKDDASIKKWKKIVNDNRAENIDYRNKGI